MRAGRLPLTGGACPLEGSHSFVGLAPRAGRIAPLHLKEIADMRVYYDRDADLNLIKGKKVAIVGYGSQGRAHALNLKDSGAKELRIALKPGSATAKKVEADGLQVMSVAEAAKWADLLMMATPDELQADIYKNEIADKHPRWRRDRLRARPQRALRTSSSRRRRWTSS